MFFELKWQVEKRLAQSLPSYFVIVFDGGDRGKRKLTVGRGEVGQRVVALLTVHDVLQVQEEQEEEQEVTQWQN